ncbi:MAG: cation:proton antiporter [Euryarchaeota archaeon]|nr:cation:proton antiporter [Euryarchaeota archaeon]
MTLSLLPFLLLLVLAVAVVAASKWVKVPLTIALVALGILLGLLSETSWLGPTLAGVASIFTPSVFFDLLLPPIVFEAAIHVNFRALRSRAATVLFLVFVGVVLTAIFTGEALVLVGLLPLGAALLLASILSPTDPIGIVDLFKRIRVPQELSTIVESESLLNDAVGVILFTLVLTVVATGRVELLPAVEQFFWLIGGGAAIGLLVAGGVYVLHRELHDPAVETALTVVAAYGSYLIASSVGASGIVSTALAGIAVGTFVAPRAMDPEVRQSVVVFWNVVVYIDNSVIFLAMGLLFAVSSLEGFLPLILLTFALLFVGRALSVYAHIPFATLSSGRDHRLPREWYHVLTLSGIRGALPVVLALGLLHTSTGLPTSTVHVVVAGVLGVALLSIVTGNIVADRYVARTFRHEVTSEGASTGSEGSLGG